jgi:hypothetical protein
MSEAGQKAKYSLRAHRVRFDPESGLKSDIAGGPVRASNGHVSSHFSRVSLTVPVLNGGTTGLKNRRIVKMRTNLDKCELALSKGR